MRSRVVSGVTAVLLTWQLGVPSALALTDAQRDTLRQHSTRGRDAAQRIGRALRAGQPATIVGSPATVLGGRPDLPRSTERWALPGVTPATFDIPIDNAAVQGFVNDWAGWTGVANVEVVADSDEETLEELEARLLREAIEAGELIDLGNGTYYAHSHPQDTARSEERTFVATHNPDDAGLFNNWRHTDAIRPTVVALMRGASAGKTMYVIPYLMGPPGSPLAQAGVGVELTDSRYVVLQMIRMTRLGQVALEALGESEEFVRGVNVTGDLDAVKRATPEDPEDERYFVTVARDREILHYGSAYGGNALLGKIAHGLRLASFNAHQSDWLVAQMGLMGLEDTWTGETTYFVVGFPSASGKTNLVMMEPPRELADRYKIHFLGDDIVWIYRGEDGRPYAFNPEYGVFGVAKDTNERTNPHAMTAIRPRSGTIFTNTARNERTNELYWEGKLGYDKQHNPIFPEDLRGWLDWQGRPISARPLEQQRNEDFPWNQPNSRFTTRILNVPNRSPEWENPQGVPISGVLWGGRVSSTRELLIRQLRDGAAGVHDGATMGVETTAAIEGGPTFRPDPMAMMGFYSHPEGRYFQRWLDLMGDASFFHVNWFARDEEGGFLWPGYGENIRALVWAAERVKGQGEAIETPIGFLPTPDALNLEGLDIPEEHLARILTYDPEAWRPEVVRRTEYLAQFGETLPEAVREAHQRFIAAVTAAAHEQPGTGSATVRGPPPDQETKPDVPGSPAGVFGFLNQLELEETTTRAEITQAPEIVRAEDTVQNDLTTLNALGLLEVNGRPPGTFRRMPAGARVALTPEARLAAPRIQPLLRNLGPRASVEAREALRPHIEALLALDSMWFWDQDGGAISNQQGRNLLGGKGYNLWVMSKVLGLPVPVFGTIPTHWANDYLAGDLSDGDVRRFNETIITRIEEATGEGFGNPGRPLLVSARSGARISMPGMMDTILNIGLNDQTVEGLERRTNARAAWDSYRRLVQMFGGVVLGVGDADHDPYEEALEALKQRRGGREDTELTAEDFQELVETFKEITFKESGQRFPQDVHAQLLLSTVAVFKSWNSERALVYRRRNRIPGDWGTAVSIVHMVFGNTGDDSATGVSFTRDSNTGAPGLVGEYLVNAQGEDVVAGIRTPNNLRELAARLPEAYAALQDAAARVEAHFHDMQDMEWTVQDGTFWMLQTRSGKRAGQAALRIALDLYEAGDITKETAILQVSPQDHLEPLLHDQFDPEALRMALELGRGLGASPGAAKGIIALTSQQAVQMDRQQQELPHDERRGIILLRSSTNQADMPGINVASGIVTLTGGITSHAALVARGFGIPAAVGLGTQDIEIDIAAGTVTIGGTIYRAGEDAISVDGTTGIVYAGELGTIPSEIIQYAQMEDQAAARQASELYDLYVRFSTLVAEVSQEQGGMGSMANADNGPDALLARQLGAVGIGLTRTEHMFQEEETRLPQVRRMLVGAMTNNVPLRDAAIEAVEPMQREDFREIFYAMDGLPVVIRLLDPPLHEFLPDPNNPEEAEAVTALAQAAGTSGSAMRELLAGLAEDNPMMGYRGVRLLLRYPEIARMQARAIINAAIDEQAEGVEVHPKIMVPVVAYAGEYQAMHRIIKEEADRVIAERGVSLEYQIGTMIEITRAPLVADEIAGLGDFVVIQNGANYYSFGTNDLTQTIKALSRDDYGRHLALYLEQGLYDGDPFQTIDREPMAYVALTRRLVGPDFDCGVCGEHGGDPISIERFHGYLNYVSGSPYRVPIENLATAQALLSEDDATKAWIRETAERLHGRVQAVRNDDIGSPRQTTQRARVSTGSDVRTARQRGSSAVDVDLTAVIIGNRGIRSPLQRAILGGIAMDDEAVFDEAIGAFQDQLLLALQGMLGDGSFPDVSFSLLDVSPTELLQFSDEERRRFARELRLTGAELDARIARFTDANRMIGTRGPRLLVAWGEHGARFFEAQISAAQQAWQAVPDRGTAQLNIPFLTDESELGPVLASVRRAAGEDSGFRIGVVIETPSGAVNAADFVTAVQREGFEAAIVVDLMDLTQTTVGMSAGDVEEYLQFAIAQGIIPVHPFRALDREGVLVVMLDAVLEARRVQPDIRIAVTGPQLTDQASHTTLARVVDEFIMGLDEEVAPDVGIPLPVPLTGPAVAPTPPAIGPSIPLPSTPAFPPGIVRGQGEAPSLSSLTYDDIAAGFQRGVYQVRLDLSPEAGTRRFESVAQTPTSTNFAESLNAALESHTSRIALAAQDADNTDAQRLQGYVESLFTRADNHPAGGIVIRVSNRLPTVSSARFFVEETQQAVLVFSHSFISLATPELLGDRLVRELGKDNQWLNVETAARREKETELARWDLLLYRVLHIPPTLNPQDGEAVEAFLDGQFRARGGVAAHLAFYGDFLAELAFGRLRGRLDEAEENRRLAAYVTSFMPEDIKPGLAIGSPTRVYAELLKLEPGAVVSREQLTTRLDRAWNTLRHDIATLRSLGLVDDTGDPLTYRLRAEARAGWRTAAIHEQLRTLGYRATPATREAIQLAIDHILRPDDAPVRLAHGGRAIVGIDAREVLDSRGNPTLWAQVTLADGTTGTAQVPSGASTGEREAVELRDEDPDRFGGKGVRRAAANVVGEIQQTLVGMDSQDAEALAKALVQLDGTENKERLGANATLAVSRATARAAAKQAGMPLYRYIGGEEATTLPVPFLNILNGGAHAGNNVYPQEFMIAPVGARSFAEAYLWGTRVYEQLWWLLVERGYYQPLTEGVEHFTPEQATPQETLRAIQANLRRVIDPGFLGNEKGFAPNIRGGEDEVFELLLEAIRRAGLKPGREVALALDIAASELYGKDVKTGERTTEGQYRFGERELTREALIAQYTTWLERYPIISIEDGMSEHDTEGRVALTQVLGDRVQLVGDDQFVTQDRYLREGIEAGDSNAILLKDNQVGTWEETRDTWRVAQAAGYNGMVSHRSGETPDPFIAHLAVGLGTGQIKPGAPFDPVGDAREVAELGEAPPTNDRTSKLDELLTIEAELGDRARYADFRLPAAASPAIVKAYRARLDEQFPALQPAIWERVLEKPVEHFASERAETEVVLINAEVFGEGPDLPVTIEHFFEQLRERLGVDSVEEVIRRGKIKLIFHDPHSLSQAGAELRFQQLSEAITEVSRGAVDLKKGYFSAFVGGSAQEVAEQVEAVVGSPISLVLASQDWVDQFRAVPSLTDTLVAVVFNLSPVGEVTVRSSAAAFQAGLAVLVGEGKLDPVVAKDLDVDYEEATRTIFTTPLPTIQTIEQDLRGYQERVRAA